MKLQTAVCILFSILVEISTMPPVNHCLSKFEDSLKQTLALKKSCDEANLRDCCQIAEASKIIDSENYTPGSGVYDIRNVCQSKAAFTRDIYPPMQARCEMESNGGGWIVLVRRTPDVDQRELFNRTWKEYENGFGNLSGEFWFGLMNMHCLTSQEQMEVEVEVRKRGGESLVLRYGSFKVDDPSTSYTLRVSNRQDKEPYDYLGHHNGAKFTTHDRDNHPTPDRNCEAFFGNGGWWYNNCYRMVLTTNPPDVPKLYTNQDVDYHYAELRVRPKKCLEDRTPTCE